MDIVHVEDKRREFKSILRKLAVENIDPNSKSGQEIFLKLEWLYFYEGFRHFYSDIFDVLSQINNQNINGDINTLAQNITILRNHYTPERKTPEGKVIDISSQIYKLYDHLNLEIGRLNCFSTSKETNEKIAQVDQRILKLKSTADETEKTLKHQQTEYITILGIFASIVLAFTGGIAFSTSVLNNIASVSAYRIVIVTLLIGLILCNAIFGLFFYLGKIIRNKASIIPFTISNIVILVLLIISIIAWNFGWIESRNMKFNSTDTIQNITDNIAPEQTTIPLQQEQTETDTTVKEI